MARFILFRPGLSALNLGSTLMYHTDWGTEFIHYVSIGFHYPTTTWGLFLETPIEDLSWDQPGNKRWVTMGVLEGISFSLTVILI
ncbi:MAG TPA: hypothetical protein GXZ98_08330 [Firmicutes bacterium]|jgi:hypothetical protein|nr:hypothetical protein [Bacillota bacterium]